MRRFTVTAAILGLTALGVSVPGTAQAAESGVSGPVCDSKWGARNGNMYAWDGYDCSGTLLISTPGVSTNWGGANDRASSVMNRGFTGNLAIVEFYYLENYAGGETCLYPGELYADDLSDNSFTNGATVDNNIRSHRWVNGGCGATLT
ncbi:peptidase inhibitor family I36 protein [Streptomyces sp. MMBL 11-3]|uniref:peptidase inhibitor family I36 protein n=1 Tax=Streptomyces sp. MMBL 11-3 TaxID=3382639 RepID=UPI0039B4AE10